MNQLTVEPTNSAIKSLQLSAGVVSTSEYTYNVVKFMVKVKLIEKRVNSHVGNVMVLNVMSQTSAPGTILTRKKTNLPTRASIPAALLGSVVRVAFMEVLKEGLLMAATAVLAREDGASISAMMIDQPRLIYAFPIPIPQMDRCSP